MNDRKLTYGEQNSLMPISLKLKKNTQQTPQLVAENFVVRRGNTEISNRTRALIHDCYINKLNWNIIYPNPSGIKIVHTEQGAIIQDDYDDIAKWFVLKDKNQIIACARLCQTDNDGLLEVERYENAKKALKPFLENKAHCNLIELSREAAAPLYYLDYKCHFLLLKHIFYYCLIKKHTLLTTTNIYEWLVTYDKLGFPKFNENRFKYFDEEPEYVDVFLAGPSQIEEMLCKIEYYIDP